MNLLEVVENNKFGSAIINAFMKELAEIFDKESENTRMKDDIGTQNTIYVVKDINDSNVLLVDTNTGENLDVNLSRNVNISSNDFYSIDLGSNLILKNGKFEKYDGILNIKNDKAKRELEDLYFNLQEEEGQKFIVKDIDEEKIYLSNVIEGGYFSIYKMNYPNIKVGDILKKENNTYKEDS